VIGKLICKIRKRHNYKDDITIQRHDEQWYMHYNHVCQICKNIVYVDIYVTHDKGITWREIDEKIKDSR